MAGAPFPTDKCLLHIPNKNVGAELIAEVKKITGVKEIDVAESRKLDQIAKQLDDNWDAIERWVDRFYKECICDCGGA